MQDGAVKATSSRYVEFVLDQLRPFGAVTARRMFGGFGLYRDGAMFGLIAEDALYFRTAPNDRPAYEAAGMGPFTYETKKGRNTIAAYWAVPAEIQEEPPQLADWAKTALAAALAAKTSAGQRPRRERAGRKAAVRRRG